MSEEKEKSPPPLFFGERVVQNILMSGSFLALLWAGNSLLELKDRVTILAERNAVLREEFDEARRELRDLSQKFTEYRYRTDKLQPRQ